MFNWGKRMVALLLLTPLAGFAGSYPNALNDLGRPAPAGEITAWDIDVRPDFVGLPEGSGSVEDGEALWLD